MGMFDDALQIIRKGLERHPDFGPAHIVLARVLCQLEDFSGSIAAFEQALELDGDNLAALVGYARVKILLGDELAAREILLKARSLSPADPVINKLLLSLPEQFEDEVDTAEQGEAACDEAADDNPRHLVSQTLAELYLAQGLTEKALELFRTLSQQDPDNLALRRKVRELETQLERDSAPAIAEPDSEPLEQPISHEEESVGGAEPDVPEVEEEAENNVLDTLNRWLSNIQQRRKNV